MVVKPSPANGRETFNSTRTSGQLATSGGIEVVAVLVTGGGGSAAVRIYDSVDGANEASPSINSFLVTANAGESTPFTPVQSTLMKKGLYVELEVGGATNGEATIFYNKP